MAHITADTWSAYEELVRALKTAHPDFHLEHTGGGCFVLTAELGNDFNLAVSSVDGPLVFPEEAGSPMELLMYHEEDWGSAWVSVYREESADQLDPEHRELVAIARGAAAAADIVTRILRDKREAQDD